MNRRLTLLSIIGLVSLAILFVSTTGIGQQPITPPRDAVEEAQRPRPVQSARPEQQKSPPDQSDIFGATNAPASSPTLENQPEQGKMQGFDFARDPLNAKRPMQAAEEIMKNDIVGEAESNRSPAATLGTSLQSSTAT